MRPAFSVLLLTVLIGAGQGLYLALFSVQLHVLLGLLPPLDGLAGFYAAGSAIALFLLTVGLLASFFHLGRPERAWRTAAQWRSSWLSREVIALPAFMGMVALYALTHALQWSPALGHWPSGAVIDASLLLGLLGCALAFALYLCTAMIYACLRFLTEWHTPLTLVNFVLLGAASGFTLGAAFASLAAPGLVGFLSGWALILTLAAALARGATLWRNARLKPVSTMQSAIGIKHPVIVQKSQGFMGGSFNTREFFHGRGPHWVRAMKWGAWAGGLVLPALLLLGARGAGAGAMAWLIAAVAVQLPGLLAERWIFFAMARHPQNLYYGAAS